MIRLVKKIEARIAERGTQLTALPLLAPSGTFRTDIEDTEAGLQMKKTLTARLHPTIPGDTQLRDFLRNDLVVKLTFEDGTTEIVGTEDIPVRLKISHSDTLDISAEHISRAD